MLAALSAHMKLLGSMWTNKLQLLCILLDSLLYIHTCVHQVEIKLNQGGLQLHVTPTHLPQVYAVCNARSPCSL